jgi:allophanate hydrolase
MASDILLAVVGAHLRGQPLNHQLTDRGATFLEQTTTSDCYRLFALATAPPKPGLIRVADDDPTGGAIEVELWSVPAEQFGSFVDEIPAPLGIGRLVLADGGEVAGFICEPIATADAPDITEYGGWRAFLESRRS